MGLCDRCKHSTQIESIPVRRFALSDTNPRTSYAELIVHSQEPFIHRLPFEIASQIFRSYVEDINFRFSFDTTEKSDWSAPLLLGAVCTWWRDIAWTTPQLWTSINISLSFARLPALTELTQQWLGRSGQLPLSIGVFLDPIQHENTRRGTHLQALFDAVTGHAPRWRNLIIEILPSLHPSFLGSLKHAPNLETLCISPVICQHWDQLGGHFSLPETPVLRELRVDDVFLLKIHVQWDSIAKFSSSALTVDEVIEVLRRAPRLAICNVLKLATEDNIAFPLPSTPFVHHGLERLQFHSFNSTDDSDFFNHVTLPSLNQLVLTSNYGPGSDTPVDVLLSFFERSQCRITTFAVYEPGISNFTESEIIQLLKNMPALKHLSLSSSKKSALMTDTLLNLLAGGWTSEHDGITDRFLPCLEVLQYAGPMLFCWDSFLKLFELDGELIHPFPAVGTLDVSPSNPTKFQRPLREVDLIITRPFRPAGYLDKEVALRLTQVIESGVTFKIQDEKLKDLLESALESNGPVVHGPVGCR